MTECYSVSTANHAVTVPLYPALRPR